MTRELFRNLPDDSAVRGEGDVGKVEKGGRVYL